MTLNNRNQSIERRRDSNEFSSMIPVELIRQHKEQLKREIIELREKLVQCENEMTLIQSQHDVDGRMINAKQLTIGRKRFNENPKEGLVWLVENHLIENQPEQIAEFLLNDTGLSKRAIGELLGEHDQFYLDILKFFSHLQDFFGIDLVEALRRFLSKFILPGEAQKIDRIIESFSHRFYECNPDQYVNADVCFILSFALIMLNTSLHNRRIRNHSVMLTYEKFLQSLNDAIPKENFPDLNLIKNIYDSIKTTELKFPEDVLPTSTVPIFSVESVVIKEGWLWKQGGLVRNWRRRWFVITDGCAFYFESVQDMENPRGIIPLIDIGVRDVDDDRTKQFCFELYPLSADKMKTNKPIPGEPGRMTEGSHTVFRMSAGSEEERKDWIRTIRIATQNQMPKIR